MAPAGNWFETAGVTTLRSAVLVEGVSDRAAVQALAGRLGRDLRAEGVAVVAMGGVTNVRACAARYGPSGLGVRVAGLYDAPAEAVVRRGLAAVGLGAGSGPLPDVGFYACRADLEEELIRALGGAAVEEVIAAEGERRSLHLLAGMPVQRDWPRERVLHRFLGGAGRKERYATLLVDALKPDRIPAPLAALLKHVAE